MKLCKKCKNNMNNFKSFKMKYSNTVIEEPYLKIKTEFPINFEYTCHITSPNGRSYKSDDTDSTFTEFSKYSSDEQSQKRTTNYKVFVMETIKKEIKRIKRNGVYLYNCPKCKKIVIDLKKHVEEHKEEQFSTILCSCDMCNFQTESLDEMQAHICEGDTLSNESFERHKCPICHFTSKQKGNL